MKYQCKSKEHSIVLIGNFNPKIFQPAWFASENLLQQQEADEANIEIIHSAVVMFHTNWMRMDVTQEKFVVATSQEPYDIVLRDLVKGTFDLLRYTPLKQMGINRNMHFQVDSLETWNHAGDLLTPKEIWAELLNKPGMLSVQMREEDRQDGLKGSVNIKVEPSRKIHPGISFNVNDHIELHSDSEGSKEIIEILNTHWERSYKRSKKIIYSLLERLIQR